jgi:hypothetical protein
MLLLRPNGEGQEGENVPWAMVQSRVEDNSTRDCALKVIVPYEQM